MATISIQFVDGEAPEMKGGGAVMACMCAGEAVGNTQCQEWDEAKWPQHRPPLFMRKGRR